MELLVSRTLRFGVIGSSALMLAGFVISIFRPELLSGPFQTPQLSHLLTLLLPDGEFFRRLLHPFTLFYLGILVLLLTPIVRILIALYSFLRERDTPFSVISITVFFIILLSIYLSTIVG